ncbi:MAG: hypothetical protein LBC68_01955 [Prevotellaceae bacterium]|jgi:hypothetical protein|nr:hypothetical protein [Prevotellaceae bacterium]
MNSLPEGVSTIILPPDNAVFIKNVHISTIELQNKMIVITKNFIQHHYQKLLQENDLPPNGFVFQQKYIFYEDNIFQRTVLGSFDVFEKYDKSEIQKFCAENKELIFDVACDDVFQFSFFRRQNSKLTIIHQARLNSFELIDSYLTGWRPSLNCDIVIYAGTYEISNGDKFIEKYNLMPVVSCTKLKLKTIIQNKNIRSYVKIPLDE